MKEPPSKKRADDAVRKDAPRSPSEAAAPNATTREAIADLEAGKGKRFASVKALMAELNTRD